MPTLNWIGKDAVVNHHRQVPYHLLRCDSKLSVGDPGSGNLLVQGDNLLALKALLPYYAGQVKCIYIDPPYNTGNENWVYNDNVNSPEMQKWLGKVVGKEAEDLSRHDKWLCMMYPRLALLKEFLREDGVLFVSIDDTEVSHLRLMLDEIFGFGNFVANVVWQKRTSPDARATLGPGHEHVIVYAKGIEVIRGNLNRLPLTEKQKAQFKNPDDDSRGPWVSSDFTAQGYRPNQMYKIVTPSGTEYFPPEGKCWKNVESVFLRQVEEGRIWFGKGGNAIPRRKTYLAERKGQVAWTWWTNQEAGHNQEAKKESISIFGTVAVFDTPKPERLMERMIQLTTQPGDIVLDSFAGSGTTGAVAHKMQRRWIMVEMEEHAETHVVERLVKVVDGMDQGGVSTSAGWTGGGGFRYCKLSKPIFDEGGNINPEVKFADLAAHVFFTETGEPIPKRADGKTPLIGVCNATAYYLLFNGVLGDKRVNSGNVLTGKILAELPVHAGPKVIYGEGCRLGAARLKREGITFKQVPYEIKVG